MISSCSKFARFVEKGNLGVAIATGLIVMTHRLP